MNVSKEVRICVDHKHEWWHWFFMKKLISEKKIESDERKVYRKWWGCRLCKYEKMTFKWYSSEAKKVIIDDKD